MEVAWKIIMGHVGIRPGHIMDDIYLSIYRSYLILSYLILPYLILII
jgi:hypothetical protein